MSEPSEWISSTSALALMGQEVGDVEDPAFDGAVAGARAYVERKRSDLWVTAGDPPVTTFEPGADVLLGTAMLAHRLYERRSAPLGAAEYAEFGGPGTILRFDPDIAKLLGIGTEGAFVVGATLTAEAQAALAEVE